MPFVVVFGIWFVCGKNIKLGGEGEGDDLDKLGRGKEYHQNIFKFKNHFIKMKVFLLKP